MILKVNIKILNTVYDINSLAFKYTKTAKNKLKWRLFYKHSICSLMVTIN